MISIQQIRAGRGLLNWTQRQLADAAGISLRTLSSIELGETVPREDTLKCLQDALEAKQIIFGNDHGVKLSGERMEIHKYEGAACQEILLTDIIDQLRWHGGEVWMNGVDDWRFGEIQTGVMDKYFKNIWTYKIKEMVLCEKGFQQLVSPSSHYRAVPKEILGKLAYYIYHDCVAMMTWEPSMRLIITRNATIAGHFRNQFRSVWENADPLPFTRFLAKDENNDTPWSMNRAEAVRKKIKKIGY